MRAIGDRVRRHPLLAFFALAYGVNAAACGLGLAVHGASSSVPLGPFWLVGIFSPTIAGLVTARVVGGTPAVRAIVDALLRWRIGWRWFLVGAVFVLAPLVLAIASLLLGNAAPGPAPGLTLPGHAIALVYTAVAGPLSEEPGWRGFALPRLQARHDALTASIVLGLAWAFWHVPFYLLPGQVMIPFPIFVPQCVALAIVFTAIFNNTGGSVFATVLAHFWFNVSGAWLAGHLGIMPPMLLYVGGSLMVLALVVVVVAAEGPRRLSRRPAAEIPTA
jgi:membrane protease YdiL (CAAX protease family)